MVNLTKVFESHPTLKTQLESVQQQLKGVERDFDTKQKELSNRGKSLSDLSPTSDEYKRLESELARQVADLQVQARQAKKDFLQREALTVLQCLQRNHCRRARSCSAAQYRAGSEIR